MSSNTKNRFFTAIEQGRVPHACFIACPDMHESFALAQQAAALFCTGSADTSRLSNCPDFFGLDENDYVIDNLRELLNSLSKQAYSKEHGRAVILNNSHAMSEACQNALLKTLEEPPAKTLFLLTGNEAGLLPTIRSRCSTIRLGTYSREQVQAKLLNNGLTEKDAILYTALGEGLFERAYKLYTNEEFKALRENSVNALITFLEGKLNFDLLKTLSANKSSQEAVTFTLSFMRDMLLFKSGFQIECNIDKRSEISTLCDRFTIQKINSIINIMIEAKSRLTISPIQAPILDRMFTKISEEI